MNAHTQVQVGILYKALLRVLVVLAMLVCIALPSMAQSYRGSIHGSVHDTSGATVAGAKITLKGSETGLTRDTTSADDGVYVISELPAGTYAVTAVSAGFAATTYNAVVEVSADTTLDFGEQRWVVQLSPAARCGSRRKSDFQRKPGERVSESVGVRLSGRKFRRLGPRRDLRSGLLERGLFVDERHAADRATDPATARGILQHF